MVSLELESNRQSRMSFLHFYKQRWNIERTVLSFNEGDLKVGNVLIIGKGSLFTSVISSNSFTKMTFDVLPYKQYFKTLYNKENENRRLDKQIEMEKDFLVYDKVYIISDSINEGFELTILFSGLGTRRIIVVTQCSRDYQLYKKLGAKLVYISKPGSSSYSWLTNHL